MNNTPETTNIPEIKSENCFIVMVVSDKPPHWLVRCIHKIRDFFFF